MDFISLYESGFSLSDVSKKTGIAKSTIRFRLKKLGLLRDIKEAIKKAGADGKMSRTKTLTGRKVSQETRAKMSKSKTARGLGVRVNTNGYCEYTMGEHKGRNVHTVMVEEIIGRRLTYEECVHHLDHNKLNNDINNLKLITKKCHASYHAKFNYKNRKKDSSGRFI